MRFVLVLFLSFGLHGSYLDYKYKNKSPTFNSFGQAGLIQVPTAENFEEGGVYFNFNYNELYKFGALTVSPFDWLDASYFYYRPTDLLWGSYQGLYLDKGFNVKLTYEPKINFLPKIALGLDDFAGTGQFSKEYIVGTYDFTSFKASMGIGWGKFVGKEKYKNPLGYISEVFNTRQADFTVATGGTLETKAWFRGPATFFGGLEYHLPYANGLKAKIEYSPYDYFNFLCCGEGKSNLSYVLRNKDSDINFGLSYPLNDNAQISLSYFKGNTLNLSFVVGINSKNIPKKKKFDPKIALSKVNKKDKNSFYIDLMNNLNNNKLYLQTAEISNKNIEVVIVQSTYNSAILSAVNTANITNNIAKEYDLDFNSISIKELKAGIELNKITISKNDLANQNIPEILINGSKLESGDGNSFLKNEFRPILKFPQFFSKNTLDVINHIGSPSRFYLGGLILKNTSELQFSRNLMLYSELHYRIKDNFDKKVSFPGSSLPHVRTEILQYLQESDGLSLNRSQLDYYFSPQKNTFVKFTGGILESMYGGIGTEVLYKPFNKNYSVGADLFKVKRRFYDQKFKFLDYKTTTGHLNFHYLHPGSGIMATIKYGKYLAGDVGYTLDLSRRTNKGFVAGFFFSMTNVSYEEFGEGSFDKGFYFKVPFDIFSNNRSQNSVNFKIKPLTRDGGAVLEHHNSLNMLMYNSNYYEIRSGWNE